MHGAGRIYSKLWLTEKSKSTLLFSNRLTCFYFKNDYILTILLTSRVTDIDRTVLLTPGIAGPLRMIVMFFSALSARWFASSAMCCAFRYLFMVMFTTSSWKHSNEMTVDEWLINQLGYKYSTRPGL